MSEKNLETMDHRFTVPIKTLWSLSQENLTYREEDLSQNGLIFDCLPSDKCQNKHNSNRNKVIY